MLHRACRQHLSEEQRAQPAGSLIDHPRKSDLHIGCIESLHASELLHVLGGLLDHGIDDVVDRDDAEHMAPLIHDRNGKQVVFGDKPGDVLAIGRRRYGDWPPVRGNRQHRVLRRAGDQSAKRHWLDQDLGFRIEDVNGVDRFPRLLDFADIIEGLADRPCGRDADEFRGHDAARGILGVGEQTRDRGLGFEIELRKQPLADRLVEMPENVGGPVVRHRSEKSSSTFCRLRLDQFFSAL